MDALAQFKPKDGKWYRLISWKRGDRDKEALSQFSIMWLRWFGVEKTKLVKWC
jgi:hypothetical protein